MFLSRCLHSCRYGKDYDYEAPVKLLDALLHGMAGREGEQVVVLSQVLAADVNLGYEDICNTQVGRVLAGVCIKVWRGAGGGAGPGAGGGRQPGIRGHLQHAGGGQGARVGVEVVGVGCSVLFLEHAFLPPTLRPCSHPTPL